MKLVIVESPTKAKTLSRFLGSDFMVTSSFGHIRDLPASKIGVDVENNFAPHYVVPRKNQKRVTELKKAAAKSDMVLFATDADREGEAIAWHLAEVLQTPKEKSERITFHEITKEAILDALKHPRDIDIKLVDAQQARRILDRLVGYELSPFLWKKVAKGLSAGRVQSVAMRLIVDREREIEAFKTQEYWTIGAIFNAKQESFEAKLHKTQNKILDKFDIPNETEAKRIIDDLQGATYKVADIQQKQAKRHALAPFITSTLQQEANRRLGFSAKQTMMLAQQLYEGVELGGHGAEGLITYMRTDSVNLSEKFLGDAKQYITQTFGEQYATPNGRKFTTKSKTAQEAHEAIRPTEGSRTPEEMRTHLDDHQWKLYDLIWRRAIASQMADAQMLSTTIDVDAKSGAYTFRAAGSVVQFDGFMKVWLRDSKDEILPALKTGDPLTASAVTPEQHFTEPPARYSDATLVKILEEYGIGRPSTYAPTIATILERNYVERIENRRLKPTEIGILVNDVLVAHFPNIVDYNFTATMENSLDEIAEGKKQWVPVLREFYTPFHEHLEQKYKEISKQDIVQETTGEICEKCGKPMIIKMGRYGKFMACSGFPECRNIRKTPQEAQAQAQKSTGVKCGECGQGEIVERRSKRGKLFYSCNRYPDCKFALWNRPNGEKCPKCGSLLVWKKKDTVGCSNKECDFEPKTVVSTPGNSEA